MPAPFERAPPPEEIHPFPTNRLSVIFFFFLILLLGFFRFDHLGEYARFRTVDTMEISDEIIFGQQLKKWREAIGGNSEDWLGKVGKRKGGAVERLGPVWIQVHPYFFGARNCARANNSSNKFPRSCERLFAGAGIYILV